MSEMKTGANNPFAAGKNQYKFSLSDQHGIAERADKFLKGNAPELAILSNLNLNKSYKAGSGIVGGFST